MSRKTKSYSEIAAMPQATAKRSKNCLQPQRRQWIIDYLTTHGPSRAVTIAQSTEIPVASTTSVLLHYKDTFKKQSRHVWQLVDQIIKPVEWAEDVKRPWWSYVD